MGGTKRIAEIEEHKVGTGETLAGVARANAMTWQELADFNWASSDPDAVNRHLRDDVGCRRKAPGGQNYVFDNADDPGEIFIPKPWAQAGLPTDQTHTIRVRRLGFKKSPLVIRLFDWRGQPLPGAPYAVAIGERELQRGHADSDGDVTLPDLLADTCSVRWGRPEAMRERPSTNGDSASSLGAAEEFEFARDVFLNIDADGSNGDMSDEAARRRLHNMGYCRGKTLADNVRAFQRDIGVTITGRFEDVHSHLHDCHDQKCRPPGECSTATR